jgi:hypothetical protein
MEQNFFAILSKKVITTVIAIGSMFYSTIDGVNATFSDIEFYSQGQHLYISTNLTNCFTEDLDLILVSGERITIFYQLDLISDGNKNPVYSDTLYHSIQYSPVDQIFQVYQSNYQNYTSYESLENAKNDLVLLNDVPIIELNNLIDTNLYSLRLSAWMGTVQIAGMDKPLNLMYYWNSIKPEKESAKFIKADLQK